MVHFSNTVTADEATAVAVTTDAGVGAGRLLIYDDTGAVPTDADTAITTQVLLADIPLNDPAWDAPPVDAVPGSTINLDVVPIPEANAALTGTANFGRIVDSDTTNTIQLDTVGVGSGELQLNTLSITSGTAVQVTAGAITIPES